MNDRLLALRLFARVAHTASFSRAAREAGLSQPSASRIVAALEQELGAALLLRSTRAVTLTEAGANYLARIEPVLAALEEADQAVRGDGEFKGTLRMALSSSFGAREVIPRIPEFLALHPALKIHIQMGDARHDLVTEGIDLAFRLGTLPDSSMLARKLGQSPRVVIAAPAYLAKAPPLTDPACLARHSVILGPGAATPVWHFHQNSRKLPVGVEGRLIVTANEAAIAAAVAGLGIAVSSFWGCRAELERGDLVQVLADWHMDPADLYAVFPNTRTPKPAARAFAGHLGAALQAVSTSRC